MASILAQHLLQWESEDESELEWCPPLKACWRDSHLELSLPY